MYSSSNHRLTSMPGRVLGHISSKPGYSDQQYTASQRKLLKDIYMLQTINETNTQRKPSEIDYQKMFSQPQKHSRVPSFIKLPPLLTSQRNSIDSSLSISPMPIIQQADPNPIIKKQITKSQRHFARRSTIINVQPFTIKNCVLRCSFKTRIGSIMNINKPQNQDNFIITSNIKSTKGQYLFAVCDGHGEDGHYVSGLIKKKFVLLLEKNLPEKPTEDKDVYYEALKKSYSEINDIVMNGEFDCEFSGSTFVSILIIGNQVYCANVGDSRAVLGKHEDTWQAIDLSKDHKPDRQDECSRILSLKGRIESLNGSGPLRIWKEHENTPGLAMSRSIGDGAGKEVGVISEPEIQHFLLLKSDKFLIIASDGVWDYITSQEAINIISKVYKKGKSELCCEVLLKEAVAKWENFSQSVDDITILVIFLRVKN